MKCIFPLYLFSALIVFAGSEARVQPLPDFASLLRDTDELIVYEGLPHPSNEPDSFLEEARTKQTFTQSDQYFYEKPLACTPEDKTILNQIFRTVQVCEPYRGQKLCGGFHADYLFEWRKEHVVLVKVLLCLGCDETLVIVGDKEQQTELSKEAIELFRPLLKKYPRQRPPFKLSASRDPHKPQPLRLPPPKIEIKP